jgi:hypothetical protein
VLGLSLSLDTDNSAAPLSAGEDRGTLASAASVWAAAGTALGFPTDAASVRAASVHVQGRTLPGSPDARLILCQPKARKRTLGDTAPLHHLAA